MECYQINTDDGPIKVAPYELARDLEKENEQLKAQVNELLDQLQYIASQYSNCGCGHPACRRCQDQRENDEIIARIEKGLK